MAIGVGGRRGGDVGAGETLFHLVDGGPCQVRALLWWRGCSRCEPSDPCGVGSVVGGEAARGHRSCGAESRGAASP